MTGTILRIVSDPVAKNAEEMANRLIEEYEKQSYDVQVLNLTPNSPQERIFWRFVLLFVKRTVGPTGPPDES